MELSTYLNVEQAKLDFIAEAAKAFESNPTMNTYGDLIPGSFLAIRWGQDKDCIKLMCLDDSHPILYKQCIGEVLSNEV